MSTTHPNRPRRRTSRPVLESLEPRCLLACQKVAYIVAGLGGVDYPVDVMNDLISRGFIVHTPWWNSRTPTQDNPVPDPNNPGRFTPYVPFTSSDPGSLTIELPTDPNGPALLRMNLGVPNTATSFADAVVNDLITNYDADDLVVLIGHGLGGASVLEVARRIEASAQAGQTDVNIDFLGLLDPMGYVPVAGNTALLMDLQSGRFFDPFIDDNVAAFVDAGYSNGALDGTPVNDDDRIPAIRAGLPAVPSSVTYLYNRWQTNAILPFDFFEDGFLNSNATGSLNTDFGVEDQRVSNTVPFHPATDLERLFGLTNPLAGDSDAHVNPNFPLAASIQDELLDVLGQLDDEFACFVVTTVEDILGGQPARGSLRAALLAANRVPGSNAITFNIPGPLPFYAIHLDAPLPAITDPVTIDGSTQPGFINKPIVVVDGLTNSIADGFVVQTNNVLFKDLVITGFTEAGVHLLSGTGHRFENNWIGLDPSGNHARGNGVGILIEGASKLTIGGTAQRTRNVISGNVTAGIYARGAGTGDIEVLGNYIGTNHNGTAPIVRAGTTDPLVALQKSGIVIDAQGNVLVGGTTAEARNIISGNYVGLMIAETSTSSAVVTALGNYIGTTASGQQPLANIVGVYINNTGGHQIGGTAPGAANVISANSSVGIEILGEGATGNRIDGNIVGLAADGQTALFRNGQFAQESGIFVQDASKNLISDNTISANSVAGVYILSRFGVAQGNQFLRNRIGLAQGGNAQPGNGLYGALFYNARNNSLPINGADANLFGPSRGSRIRDYTGPVPAETLALRRLARRPLLRRAVRFASRQPVK